MLLVIIKGGTLPTNSNDLASLFECPVCFDYALPPIMQCQSGHIVCTNCRPKLQFCPTCRGALGNIRNLAMEKVASQVLFPCRYYTNGCEITLPHTDKTSHEDGCEFRPYNCPCPGASCKWQGSLEHVMAHLLQQHKSITTLQGYIRAFIFFYLFYDLFEIFQKRIFNLTSNIIINTFTFYVSS